MTNTELNEFLEEILTDTERVITLIKAFRYAKTDDLNFKPGEDDMLAGCAEDILKLMREKIEKKYSSEDDAESRSEQKI